MVSRSSPHWLHITAGLQCRRGPTAILVQCRDQHGSFALSAHSWTGQEYECSVMTGICGMYTVGSTGTPPPHRLAGPRPAALNDVEPAAGPPR
jgi:hypothetical protein